MIFSTELFQYTWLGNHHPSTNRYCVVNQFEELNPCQTVNTLLLAANRAWLLSTCKHPLAVRAVC